MGAKKWRPLACGHQMRVLCKCPALKCRPMHLSFKILVKCLCVLGSTQKPNDWRTLSLSHLTFLYSMCFFFVFSLVSFLLNFILVFSSVFFFNVSYYRGGQETHKRIMTGAGCRSLLTCQAETASEQEISSRFVLFHSWNRGIDFIFEYPVAMWNAWAGYETGAISYQLSQFRNMPIYSIPWNR